MEIKYKTRLFIWQILFVLVFIVIWLQLFKIQVIESTEIVSEALKQFTKQTVLLRGDIRDRNGTLLVLDVITYDLYNNVKDIKKLDRNSVLDLSKTLNLDSKILRQKLSQRINTKILTGINEYTANKIRDSKYSFVYLIPKVARKYPHKRMAAHLIGFVNSDHKGQHGVEYFHENLLTKIYKDRSESQPFQKGTDIVLTIDAAFQEFTEQELNHAMQKSMAERGSILVLSTKTGEIFAWASQPSYDPNYFYKEKAIKNWALTDIYEPGSTFKIITVASGLENMVITASSSFYDPGFLKVGKRTIKNHNKNKPHQITLLELFKQSSNVAAAQVGLLMKPEDFCNILKRFMIGDRTGIDLPGESKGLLLNPSNWKQIDQATTAFGQGAVSVTPLQIASAIGTIANHGIWVQPHVLKGTWEPNYMIITSSPYKIKQEQAILTEVAELTSKLLRQSVKENVEAMAYIPGDIPGIEVAGKTGTAQKIRPNGRGYWGGHTVASFIGYFPADDPEILALVVIDDPKTGGGWGNTVCGPIFNEIVKEAEKRILRNKKYD